MQKRIIYQPQGKAGEYAKYACNFYTGCSNGCVYCYLKKGLGKKTLGGDTPTLRKCFIDQSDALYQFHYMAEQNQNDLRKHGIFFSFTTDPMLPETQSLTIRAIHVCHLYNIPVYILTKTGLSEFDKFLLSAQQDKRTQIAYGHTLTGIDIQEPGASRNFERLQTMARAKDAGFKTFGSFEPVIDFACSYTMIYEARNWCDLFKIGLQAGRTYKKKKILKFMESVHEIIQAPIYWKDTLLKQAEVTRNQLPSQCVDRNFNIFA